MLSILLVDIHVLAKYMICVCGIAMNMLVPLIVIRVTSCSEPVRGEMKQL